jgi:transcriptional regulator with XRE-family HTH domain
VNKESVGTYLRSYRRKNKLSQEDVANALDLTQPEICHIESGRRDVSEDVMRYMAEAGMIPENILNTAEEIKLMVDRMEYDDKLLMKDFAKRILR